MVMLVRRFSRILLLSALLGVCCPLYVKAQMDTATISGRIVDPSGRTVAGAKVELVDVERETSAAAQTNNTGLYTFSNVKPGRYRMQVSASGFRTVNLTSLTLNTQDSREQNFQLAVGSVFESVTVEAKATPVDTSGAVSTMVDQKLVTELPLNGRSFQTLFQLTPGVVIVPTDFSDQGQFSVNGQRSNANYFTVDGVSANVGMAAGTGPSQQFGGSLPALSASGGTNSLVSTDAVQEFAIQTSTYAPEFGRTPGAQVSIVTRSGINQFHGDAFDYLRNDIFDANDWFANHHGLKRAALRQNDFGGTLGGPIVKNKSFFFFSYEGLRLRQPTTGQSDVPTLAARQAAPAQIQAFFNAFPLPNGPDEGTGLAPANYAFSNPAGLDAVSLRLDHHFTQSLSIFGRYNYAPSEVKVRGNGESLNTITVTSLSLRTLTLGVTYWLNSRTINDARFNWSRSVAASFFQQDSFGGAQPLPSQGLFPAPFGVGNSVYTFDISLSGINPILTLGRNVDNTQRQINFVDTFSWQAGAHLVRAGVDYRRLMPIYRPVAYGQANLFLDVPSALALNLFFSEVLANAAPINATFINYSLYVQDTWRPSARLNMTYGVRWDYNPAPTGSGPNGLGPFTVVGIDNLPTLSLAPSGTPLYHATRSNFAPRFGLAYQWRNSPKTEAVIKAGVGIFYDLGNGPAGQAFTAFPFSAQTFSFGGTFPLSPAQASPPPITTAPPFNAPVTGFPGTLKLPYTYQWNLSLEQSLGRSQTLTLGYVGAAGRNLLRQENYSGGGLPAEFAGTVNFVTNQGYSNYNAFQAQFRRRTSNRLNVIASYTLSHSLDNVSADTTPSVPARFINPSTDYASSDFDIRHTGTFGIDYDLPAARGPAVAKALLGGWSIDPVLTARSSPPINVVVFRDIGFGSYEFRPDLVPGVPLYVDAPNPLGPSRIINPAALSAPTDQRQGTLGRNVFRGFPVLQLDFALRRSFRLTDRIRLQARVDAFNIFNHPNFASQSGFFGTMDSGGNFFPQNGFGVSQAMLAQGLQQGSFGAGFSPLYQIGGPRSLQLALKLEF